MGTGEPQNGINVCRLQLQSEHQSKHVHLADGRTSAPAAFIACNLERLQSSPACKLILCSCNTYSCETRGINRPCSKRSKVSVHALRNVRMQL